MLIHISRAPSLGLGVGFSISSADDYVSTSISLTRFEATRVGKSTDVWFESWGVDGDRKTPIIRGGQVIGYRNKVLTKNTKGRKY